jgi:hypothetical protein
LAVRSKLTATQQALIIKCAANPANVVYALYKEPKLMAQFSGLTDPIDFAVATAQLEPKLGITQRKPSTAPEKTVQSSGVKGSGDARLEQLRAEADKTGDRSKVAAYMRQQANK